MPGRALLALLLVLGAGCARKKPTPPAVSAPAAKPAAQEPNRHGPLTGPALPGVVHRVAPIRADETTDLLPAPTGAHVLVAPAHAQVGERIEGSWCNDSTDLAAIGAALAQQYGGVGWQGFTVHPNPHLPGRATLTAQKGGFALFGSLQAGRSECRGTFVSLGVHHIEAVDPRSGVGAHGTTNLRTP